ncbi:hypothetical protein [Kitasatospora sp. P5_F3]
MRLGLLEGLLGDAHGPLPEQPGDLGLGLGQPGLLGGQPAAEPGGPLLGHLGGVLGLGELLLEALLRPLAAGGGEFGGQPGGAVALAQHDADTDRGEHRRDPDRTHHEGVRTGRECTEGSDDEYADGDRRHRAAEDGGVPVASARHAKETSVRIGALSAWARFPLLTVRHGHRW